MSTPHHIRSVLPRRDDRAEPPVSELLDDPILQILMARDHVERVDLEDLIDRIRRHLHQRSLPDVLFADCAV